MTNILNDQPAKEPQASHAAAMLAPLFTWRGMDVYPVWGSEDDDTGAGDNSDSEPNDTDTDDTGSSDSEGGSDTVSRSDFEKLQRQLSAADKKRTDAEKALKKIEDGKKDELTKATERAEELEAQMKERDAENSALRLQNAFLTADTGITWHDPGDALALAERKGYLEGVADEDGKVDSKKLATKLKELAKASPHLVKTGGEESDGEKGTKPPASGSKVGSKGKKTEGDDKIPERYSRFLK
jgi:hypothetical protein